MLMSESFDYHDIPIWLRAEELYCRYTFFLKKDFEDYVAGKEKLSDRDYRYFKRLTKAITKFDKIRKENPWPCTQ